MRDRPASTESFADAAQECRGRIGEAYDLSVEAQHIPYLNALLFARILPGDDGEVKRLEKIMWDSPRGTMDKLVSAWSKLYEAFNKEAAVVLKDFERRYVS